LGKIDLFPLHDLHPYGPFLTHGMLGILLVHFESLYSGRILALKLSIQRAYRNLYMLSFDLENLPFFIHLLLEVLSDPQSGRS
jgi:uncharacterized membrane-anchored protein YitT (DUF2179 family)